MKSASNIFEYFNNSNYLYLGESKESSSENKGNGCFAQDFLIRI